MPELNADYIAKMEDLLALYERPYNVKEPVVCLDEKPVSLHAEVRPARRGPDTSQNETPNTDPVERPTSSRWLSRKPAAI